MVNRLIFDTWMYFGHRMMHLNKFLYKHIHSVHHRLYVPYAYGAAYNHPVEGFLLDVIGSIVASLIARLTPRQNLVLFTFSTLKGVHQHSRYQFTYDPMRWLSKNDTEYHNIHHQVRIFGMMGFHCLIVPRLLEWNTTLHSLSSFTGT